MADYRIYDVKLSTLAPVHIGSGRDLLNSYDYVIYGGRTWRIDEAALLGEQLARDLHLPGADMVALANQLARSRPGDLLERSDFQEDSPYVRYSIPGSPRATGEGAQLREQWKLQFGDQSDLLCVPGSAVKGALRTVLAWHAFGAAHLEPDVRELRPKREWAAQGYERKLLGRDPNHDLLRALQVSDSSTQPPDRLMIANARVVSRSGKLGSPVEVEAIRPETDFSLTIKIDNALFGSWAERAELPAVGKEWLEHLAQVAQTYAADRIKRERAWFSQIQGAERLTQYYAGLEAARLGTRRFLLQLGWGGGWDSKTFGSRFTGNARFAERIIADYRLSRRHSPNAPFPSSRRAVMAFSKDRQGQIQELPAVPFGWCLVELKERK